MMPKRKTPPPSQEPQDTEEVFDRWLGRQLAQAYEEVLTEEVPEDLKRLVRAFKDKETQSEGQPETEADADQQGAAAPETTGRNGAK